MNNVLPGIGSNPKDILDYVDKQVKKYGFFTIGSMTLDDENIINNIPFAYTVNADVLIGGELIVIGMPPSYASPIFNTIIEKAKQDKTFSIEVGQRYENINDSGYAVEIREANGYATKLINMVHAYRGDKYTGKIYQVLFEDKYHVMQGQNNFDVNMKECNILL